MADIHGFKHIKRQTEEKESALTRTKHFSEFHLPSNETSQRSQASRCMDCGIPFCHDGCPLGNLIPSFNEAVHDGDWKMAYDILASTNNFPEFTGRICPAPCESACVLGINDDAVSIEFIEKSIVERAFKNDWVKPDLPSKRTQFSIAIVGSGPAGLAAASQLNSAGHHVTIFEKNNRAGGLLRYGIPDFKLEKSIVDRRIELMKQAGVEFNLNINVGVDLTVEALKNKFDVILICTGSSVPRDLPIEGRSLKGIHFAMEYLGQNNRRVAGDFIPEFQSIDVSGQHIVVIGGGDTGSDCIGTSHRLGAASVSQLEIMTMPPVNRTDENPWPLWPFTLNTSTSHEEGCERKWSVLTKSFISDDGVHLSGIKIADIKWEKSTNGKYRFQEIEGSERIITCSKVFLAMGFLHPAHPGLLDDLGLVFDARQNVASNNNQTNVENVFVAGDANRGQSLVVWAIAEGRSAAQAVDEYLMQGKSELAAEAVGHYTLT